MPSDPRGSKMRGRAPQLARGLCCAMMAACMACALMPGASLAEVRKTDQIIGVSVGERALSASVCPSIEARHALLVGADGEVYFERDAFASSNIASVTKIMTAVVAMEEAPLSATVTVSAEAAQVGESTAGLRAGDSMTLEEALKGLMIPSGNDAAIAIAESVGKMIAGTDDSAAGNAAFVEKMNAKAAALGCENTLFENAHGLDFGSFAGDLHSSASDVSKITAYAMQNDLFRQIVDTRTAMLQVDRDGQRVGVEVITTDELLGIYRGACGVKTGFTELAGACFAGACERDGELIYAIVLDSPTESQRFTDTVTLYDWYYNHHIAYKLANDVEMATVEMDGQTREVPVVAEVGLADRNGATVKATFADPDATADVFTLYGNVSQSFEFFDAAGALEPGDVVGRATFYQRNEPIAQVDVVACESVEAPSVFDAVQVGWERFMGLFGDGAGPAESTVLNHTPTVL